LQRTPALTRGHGEEVMARIARPHAETPGRTTDGAPARSPARAALAPQPGRRHAPEAQAAAIAQELRDAGLDLSDVRDNVAAAMRGDPVGFHHHASRILQSHFPRMFELGLANNPLAAALHHTLSQSAPAAPQARLAPAGSRPRPISNSVRNAQTPPRAAGAPAPAPGRPARGAPASLMGRLAGSGIDMSHLAAAIDNTVRNGRELPQEIRGALQRAGIETHVGTGRVPMDHPLLQLRREIHLAMPEEREPSPPRAERMPRTGRRPRLGVPPIGSSRPRPPDPIAAAAGLSMPQRVQGENNAQYAWRLHYQNPRASIEQIAAATVGPSGHQSVPRTISELNAMIKVRDEIRSAFRDLPTVSRADAERLGFKDAATHNEDDATDCLFGEPLSTTNREQRVIALTTQPVRTLGDPRVADNAGVVFMDLNALARHLASEPRHPIHKAPLNAGNIRDYAFRVK
jgi:effector protein HopAB